MYLIKIIIKKKIIHDWCVKHPETISCMEMKNYYNFSRDLFELQYKNRHLSQINKFCLVLHGLIKITDCSRNLMMSSLESLILNAGYQSSLNQVSTKDRTNEHFG